jgi:hypothetical protein
VDGAAQAAATMSNRPLFPTVGSTPEQQRALVGVGEFVRKVLSPGSFLQRLLPGRLLRPVATGTPLALAWGEMNRLPPGNSIARLPQILPEWIGTPLHVLKGSPTGFSAVQPGGVGVNGAPPTVDGKGYGFWLHGAGMRTLVTDGANWFSAAPTFNSSRDFNVLDYGAAPGMPGAVNTRAIQAAIDAADAAGGGVVFIPRGTYTIASIGGGVALSLTGKSNVTIRGEGMYQTTLKMGDGQNANILNATSGTNLEVCHLKLDGNAANQTDLVHCFRTGSDAGIDGLSLHHLDVGNAKGYGIGLQGGRKVNVFLDHLYVHDTGSDTIDFKNTTDDNESIHVTNVICRRWGQNVSLNEQAALDCRGPINVTNFWASEGPDDGHYLRARDGELLDPSGYGGHRCHFSNAHLIGNGGSLAVGLFLAGRDVGVSDIHVTNMYQGVVCIAARNSIKGVEVSDCAANAFILSTSSDDSTLEGCRSHGTSVTGLRVRSPRVSVSNFFSSGSTTAGVATESLATGFSISGYKCVGVGGASMIGLDIGSDDATAVGCDISTCFRGVSVTGDRAKLSKVRSTGNTDDGFIFAAGADDGLVTGCTANDNSDDGITIRAARVRVADSFITGNTGGGIVVEAAATDARISNTFPSGNGTNVSDSGTGTLISANKQLVSSGIRCDATGTQTTSIPHGLTFTPSANSIALSVLIDSAVSDYGFGLVRVDGCTATGVDVRAVITTASSASGATFKLGALVA